MGDDVRDTAEAIGEMSSVLFRYSEELRQIRKKLLESNDLTYAAQAVTAVVNCMLNCRLDLLVTRPIRSLRKQEGK